METPAKTSILPHGKKFDHPVNILTPPPAGKLSTSPKETQHHRNNPMPSGKFSIIR